MAKKILGTRWNRKFLDDLNDMLRDLFEGAGIPFEGITSDKLAPKSITGDKIDDSTIEANSIKDGNVTYSKMTPSGKTVKLSSNNFTIDYLNKLIRLENPAFIVDGMKRYYLAKSDFELTRTTGSLVYNVKSNSIYVKSIEAAITSDSEYDVFLGLLWSGEYVDINNNFTTKVIHSNGKTEKFVHAINSTNNIINFTDYGSLTVNTKGTINIDTNLKDMTITADFVVSYKNKWILKPAIDFTKLDASKAGQIFYLPDQNKIVPASTVQLADIPANAVYLGFYWGGLTSILLNTNVDVFVDGKILQSNKTASSTSSSNNGNQEIFAKKDKLIFMGDSITEGLKSYTSANATFYDKPFAYWASKVYNALSFKNVGKSGGAIVGSTVLDFAAQYNSNNFAEYDVAVIALGVNDYNRGNSLTDVKNALRSGIEKILSDNPSIRIAGVLPQNSCRNKWTTNSNVDIVNSFDVADTNGKTLKDFCSAIKEVYEEFYIPVLDWRTSPILTKNNYKKFTWDAIHLNDIGHELQGRRIGEFLKAKV